MMQTNRAMMQVLTGLPPQAASWMPEGMSGLTASPFALRGHRWPIAAPDAMMEIELVVQVMYVWDVDIKGESFKVRLDVSMRWLSQEQDPDEETIAQGFNMHNHWEPRWFPVVSVLHCVSEVMPWDRHFCAVTDKKKRIWVHATYHGAFELTEHYQLQAFPFDLQDLSIRLRVDNAMLSKEPGNVGVRVLEDGLHLPNMIPFGRANRLPCRRLNMCVPPAVVWRLNSLAIAAATEEWRRESVGLGGSAAQTGGARRGSLLDEVEVMMLYERRAQYHVWNSGLLIFGITSCSLAAWAIHWRESANRLSFAVTLLLVAVSFKQQAAAETPPVSYLTVLDRYCLGCMAYIVMCILVFATQGYMVMDCDTLTGDCTWWGPVRRGILAGTGSAAEAAKQGMPGGYALDHWMLAGFGGVWLLFNVGMLLWTVWQSNANDQKMWQQYSNAPWVRAQWIQEGETHLTAQSLSHCASTVERQA